MSYTLRYYQEKAVEQALKNFDNYGKPFVLVEPTGSGKSLIISSIAHQLNEPLLILQPTKEILEQNYSKLLSYGINDVGIYSASMKSKTIDKFTYATIGSIYKKPELFRHFKYVLIDECHLVNPKNLGGMYNKFFADIDCRNICGLTATPYRMIQKYYTDTSGDLIYTAYIQTINRIHPFFFKKFAHTTTIQELLDKGYLCKFNYKFYDDFDVSSIKINSTGADFDEEALEKFWNDSRLKKLAQIIDEIDNSCKHNLIFCSSIRQATKCYEMLSEMGLSADVISSKDSADDREYKIAAFRTGTIKHLCNVGVLTTGFDFPALDSITLARPTLSLALLYQMAGRGMRIDPEDPAKVCQIIDITENIKKLGRIETIRLDKEEGGFKDIVMSEVGEITNKPLFKFKLTDKEKIARITNNQA